MDSVLKDADKPVTEGCTVDFHLKNSNMLQYDNLLNVLVGEPVWWADHEQVRQFNDHTLRKPFCEPEVPKAILEPFQYMNSNPGKGIRRKIIEAFNLWLDVPVSKLKVIVKIVNMLHAASLMFSSDFFWFVD